MHSEAENWKGGVYISNPLRPFLILSLSRVSRKLFFALLSVLDFGTRKEGRVYQIWHLHILTRHPMLLSIK